MRQLGRDRVAAVAEGAPTEEDLALSPSSWETGPQK
jgi:hypothetical protein